MPILYPDVNGNRTSYCSIVFGIDGAPIKGVKSINYRETHEIPKIRGTSPKPIGRTRGSSDFEGDIELYQAEWNAILPLLTKGGIFGFAEPSFTVTVSYAELGRPADLVNDKLVGVRFHSPDVANTEGTDAVVVKVGMSIMDITWSKQFKGLRIRS
jgi:hypothetical protein